MKDLLEKLKASDPNTALPVAIECLEMALETLETFKLGHEHQPDLEHIRKLGDTYGWCDFCRTKVCWGEDDARDALEQIHARLGEVK